VVIQREGLPGDALQAIRFLLAPDQDVASGAQPQWCGGFFALGLTASTLNLVHVVLNGVPQAQEPFRSPGALSMRQRSLQRSRISSAAS
jgi:hypothetical protein